RLRVSQPGVTLGRAHDAVDAAARPRVVGPYRFDAPVAEPGQPERARGEDIAPVRVEGEHLDPAATEIQRRGRLAGVLEPDQPVPDLHDHAAARRADHRRRIEVGPGTTLQHLFPASIAISVHAAASRGDPEVSIRVEGAVVDDVVAGALVGALDCFAHDAVGPDSDMRGETNPDGTIRRLAQALWFADATLDRLRRSTRPDAVNGARLADVDTSVRCIQQLVAEHRRRAKLGIRDQRRGPELVQAAFGADPDVSLAVLQDLIGHV